MNAKILSLFVLLMLAILPVAFAVPPDITINDGVSAVFVKTDTIDISLSAGTAGNYSFSADSTCNAADVYDNGFTSGVPFVIAGNNNTNYLCVNATDPADQNLSNYTFIGALKTDNTVPSGYNVAIGQAYINASVTSLTFTFSNADSNTSTVYNYSIASSGGGIINGGGNVLSPTQASGSIDVSTIADGTLTLTVNVTDGAGNIGADVQKTVTKDVLAPSGYGVTIVPVVVNDANKDAFAFDITTAVVGTQYNYTISSSGGGANVVGAGSVAGATEELTGIDVSGLNDGTLTLTVVLTDAVGNTGIPATDGVEMDATLPALDTVSSDGQTYNNVTSSPVTITLTFLEDLNTAPTVSINVEGVQAVNDCSDADAKTWCFDYDVPVVEATRTITVSGGVDMVGNVMTLDNSHTFVVDTILPTISSVSTDGQTYNNVSATPVNVTITFSEDVAIPTISVSGTGQTVYDCDDADDATWCFDYTLPLSDGTKTIAVSASADTAGNVIAADSSHTFAVENVVPQVSSVSSDGQTYNNLTSSPVTIAVGFSENVTLPVVRVSGSLQTVSNCSDLYNDTWCFSYTLPITELATKTINITAGIDGSGNTMQADLSHTFAVDTILPTLANVTSDGQTYNLSSGASVLIELNFSESVTSPTIRVGGSAQTSTNCGDAIGATWCFTYTIPATTQTAFTVNVTAAADDSGNVITVNTAHTFNVDTVRPTVASISVSDALLTDADEAVDGFVATITFSEAMSASPAPTIAFSPAVASTLTNCDGAWTNASIYDYTCDIEDDDVLSANVDIQVSAAKDAIGNAMTADTTSGVDLFSVDTVNPTLDTVEWNDVDGNTYISGTDTLVLTFSEAMNVSTVRNNTAANLVTDLALSGGHTFNSTNIVWSAGNTVLTITLGSSTTVADGDTINPANSVTDAVGNVDDSSPLTVEDAIAPIVTINFLSTTDTTPTLSGTISDPTAVLNVSVSTQSKLATNNGDGTWTVTISSALALGIYSVTVNASDTAGNYVLDSTTEELNIADTAYVFLRGPIQQLPRYSTLISNYELSNITGWSTMVLSGLLNASAGASGQRLTTSDVNAVWVYDGSEWTTYASPYTWNFDSHDSSFVGYYVLSLANTAVGRYIRHN
jgi:hypothetical protein